MIDSIAIESEERKVLGTKVQPTLELTSSVSFNQEERSYQHPAFTLYIIMSSSALSGKTTVSILISKTTSHASNAKDPYYGQRINVVVWAGRNCPASAAAAAQQQSSNSSNNGGGGGGDNTATNTDMQQLTYYHFWDHPRHWSHLDGLLTRLAPVNVIHVACTDYNLNSMNKAKPGDAASALKNMQVEKVLDNLCQMLRDRKDLTEQTVALHESSSEPPSSLVNLHTKAIPSADPARLKQLLEQMLVSENGDGSLLNRAALRVAGDVELVHHSLISRGLVLYMQSTGLWQTNTSSLPEEHQSRYEIDAGKLDSHLVLDRTAAEAIHLWPPANAGQAVVTGGRAQTNSLAGLISQHTSTVQGKRLLEAWYVRWPFIF